MNRVTVLVVVGGLLVALVLRCGVSQSPASAGGGGGGSKSASGSSGNASVLPPDLVKGAKVDFVCTNDHPFRGFEELSVVEQVHGQWVLLGNTRTREKGKTERVRRWVNFNNVVWYRVQK